MKLPADKLAHAVGGSVIACAVLCAAALIDCPRATACMIAAGVVIVAAIGKEVWDRLHPGHTCDPVDALATIAGGSLVLIYPGVMS